MGVDLLLLVITVDGAKSAFAYTTLEVERHPSLWPFIRALPSEPVPLSLTTLVSNTADPDLYTWVHGETQADTYDKPLRCVLARDLLPLATRPEVQDIRMNRAVWAYLAQIPEDMRIVLYWS